MKTENYNGYEIRFIEKDGEWWAILKDICIALGLMAEKIAQKLDPDMLKRVPVEVDDSHIFHMIAVNELGIYEILFVSKKLEARQFRRWNSEVMKKLRKTVGLEGFEVMKMIQPYIQNKINDILDTLYWDDERKCVMQSVTVHGGDVEQIPFSD